MNNEGETALIKAVENGQDLCARALIEAGANIDHVDNGGWTALMTAAQDGHEAVCTFRLEHLTFVSQPSQPFQNHDQCVRALIEAKANVEHANNNGWTSLMKAAVNGHEPVCASFLKHLTYTYQLSRTVSKSRSVRPGTDRGEGQPRGQAERRFHCLDALVAERARAGMRF